MKVDGLSSNLDSVFGATEIFDTLSKGGVSAPSKTQNPSAYVVSQKPHYDPRPVHLLPIQLYEGGIRPL
jgi:hypothetical protein